MPSGSLGVVFTLNDAESFWSALSDGAAGTAWLHAVWSVRGLPRHLYIQKIYAERWIRPRYSSRFPFIRFRDRARALAPASGRRRRLDGAIEADFLLSDAPEPGSPLTPTIRFMDQLGRRHRVSCTFMWRGAEDTTLTDAVQWSLGQAMTESES